MPAAPGQGLVRRLATFGRVLRLSGAAVDPARLQDALRALDAVDVTARDDVYWALRATLVSRHEEIEAFDVAFAWLWERRGAGEDEARHDSLAAPAPADQERLPLGAEPSGGGDRPRSQPADDADEGDDGDPDADEQAGASFSAVERLRSLDFAEYGATELRAARRVVERIAHVRPTRLSRRLERGHGRVPDMRRTMLGAVRTQGYPIDQRWQRPKRVARRLVFLIDVSGSMEPYARATLMFLHAAIRAGGKVEALTFGTRLTRVTRELTGRDPDAALERASRTVPDWAGGTRIGENLRAFNAQFGPRGLSRGAIVVIVSDGWERDDVSVLAHEMERLARASHSVLWVNPLAGDEGYEPLAQGMAAALPHVTELVSGQNLGDLEALAAVLERTSAHGRR